MAGTSPTDDQVIVEFEQICKDAASVQEQVLKSILENNAGTEYLRRHSDGQGLDVNSFKGRVPVVCYEDIAADIERIADGDRSPVLCKDPVVSFSLSSGTSGGKPKVVAETLKSFSLKHKNFQVSAAYRERVFPVGPFPTVLAFMYAGKQFEAKSGLKIGSGSTNYFRGEAFKKKPYHYTSPDEVVLGSHWRESTYCHLLCGLVQRKRVGYILATFAFAFVEALRMLKKEWRDLCQDIRTGSLNNKVMDANMRAAVSKVLHPDPESADFISDVCRKSSWSGIVQVLWPGAKYLMTIVTGAMQPYVPALRNYTDGLPIVGIDYVASEGCFGINVEPMNPPESVSFTVAPNSMFLEFVPLRRNDAELASPSCSGNYVERDPVGLAEVKVGEQYELVVTNFAGLYRYRVGDIVKVTGFFHGAPQLTFCCRKNAILSINTDKTDEEELQTVVSKASKEGNIELVDFTSYADFSEKPGHYVIFWELKNSLDYSNHELLEKSCALLDKSFNNPYMRGRAANTIGPLELVTVKEGTFERMLEYIVSNGASAGQYKTPRCINNPKMLKILKDGYVGSFRSPEFPSSILESWKPVFS